MEGRDQRNTLAMGDRDKVDSNLHDSSSFVIHPDEIPRFPCCCACCSSRCARKTRRWFRLVDWDDTLAYSTIKFVRIRDRYLGIMRLIIMLLIFLYLVVYTIVLKKGYLKIVSPIGVVQFSLDPPPSSLPDPSTLRYCEQSPLPYFDPDFPQKGKAGCQYWDTLDIMYPTVDQNAIFVTSRCSVTREFLNCSFLSDNCQYTQIGSNNTFYIADIGDYIVTIDHRIRAPAVNVKGSPQNMFGWLLLNGVRDSKYYFPLSDFEPDRIPLGVLLQAGSESLDRISSTRNKGQTVTVRFQGLVLFLIVSYSNIKEYPSSLIEYTYSVVSLNTDYKAEESVYEDYPQSRMILDRHGIKFIALQVGSLGGFDFGVLLVQFATGITLLLLSALIVDTTMLYFMRHRRLYSEAKFLVSADFSDLREGIDFDAQKEERWKQQLRYHGRLHGNPLREPLLVDDDEEEEEEEDGVEEISFQSRTR